MFDLMVCLQNCHWVKNFWVALVPLSDAEPSSAHEGNLFQDRVQQEQRQYECFSVLPNFPLKQRTSTKIKFCLEKGAGDPCKSSVPANTSGKKSSFEYSSSASNEKWDWCFTDIQIFQTVALQWVSPALKMLSLSRIFLIYFFLLPQHQLPSLNSFTA